MQGIEILVLFVLALFSLWAAGLAGLSMHLDPLSLLLILTAGYTLSVVALIALGVPLRRRLLARCLAGPDHSSALLRFVQRYGAVGLGLAAPLLTGAYLGAALGLTLNIPPRRLCLWMALGAAVWSVVLIIPVLL